MQGRKAGEVYSLTVFYNSFTCVFVDQDHILNLAHTAIAYNKLPRSKLTRYSGTSPEKFVSLLPSSRRVRRDRFSASRNKKPHKNETSLPVPACRQAGKWEAGRI